MTLRQQERDQAVQKRAYKVLAFICGACPHFIVPNLRDVLETLLSGVTYAMSAAKRYRLQCLQVCWGLQAAPAMPLFLQNIPNNM
jgi:hypothetical protein